MCGRDTNIFGQDVRLNNLIKLFKGKKWRKDAPNPCMEKKQNASFKSFLRAQTASRLWFTLDAYGVDYLPKFEKSAKTALGK
jgi:hypothetical protein